MTNYVVAEERSKNYLKLRTNLTSQIMSVLSVLTNQNSGLFVTGIDVASEIISRSGLKISSIERADFIASVCSILQQKFNNKKKTNVHRSLTKIHPRDGGKLSYGYRIGAPINIPYRDTTEIEREKHGSAIAAHSIENIDKMFADIVKNKPIHILQDYVIIIMSEIESRHNEMLLRIQEATQRNDALAASQEQIKERIVTVAKTLNTLEKKDGKH